LVRKTKTTRTTRTTKRYAAILAAITTVAVVITLMLLSQTVQAAPQHGFGTGQGRTEAVNENDFHTAAWERFIFNYFFTTGSDHRFELGRPTSFSGFVPVDVLSVNMRRDANVSLWPPSYGIFSGHIPTHPTNRLFPQPVNPHFHQGFMLNDPNILAWFDTLQQGVNFQPTGNPLNMHHNVTTGDFLPPTSVGQ